MPTVESVQVHPPEGLRVDMVIPVKALSEAKTRLLGAADGGMGDATWHKSLVLAMVTDTVTAVLQTRAVRQVLVVTRDPEIAESVGRRGATVLQSEPGGGLNAALDHGASALHAGESGHIVGALLADLPALRPRELSSFISAAGGRRAICADRAGTGTTLLLSARGKRLQPQFGSGSARAHLSSGAIQLAGHWPSLESDVDTAADLRTARDLGVGHCTAARIAAFRSNYELMMLDKHEVAMLRFAQHWTPFGGGSNDEIFIQFGITPRTYFERLIKLLSPDVTPKLSSIQRESMLQLAYGRTTEEDEGWHKH
ncbi:2-phospho-L-lactate guanylyltransferase (plasmid) [Rhodococcus sp. ZPP]|uniref:2-phospho-L-lactate guanylyltransferase n=1 Tax=Rhodococcus sp. ZPP TaxID=2749906 RepID=UPI001AD89E1E|nr:2-phospho-L-lactate guanylyltransferase [Rhodococcus sp. ZPP]QTJ70159.1 2-phospho-L-lactate guanylyltransferase [Rhodococcus sp. ZPP]